MPLATAPEQTVPDKSTESVDLCSRIEGRLASVVGASRYERYFRHSARLVHEQDGLTVAVPSAFYASWLENHFGTSLREVARVEAKNPALEVRWRVSPDQFELSGPSQSPAPANQRERGAKRLSPTKTNTSSRAGGPRRRDAGRGLSYRHTLESFVVGESNRLAWSAAREFIKVDQRPGFRALFIHGDCGVGKTHLLQGIAGAFGHSVGVARVRYMTAEAFTNEYIHAVREKNIERFRSAYRKLDLLCLDDVHFIAGKNGTQNEFMHTIDALDLASARIVLASDAHPADIEQLNRRLVSRCLAGMVVRIDRPDETLRRAIASRLARDRGLVLCDEALHELSGASVGSVRELEGVLTRVEALARLLPDLSPKGAPVPATVVRKALETNRASRPTRPVRIETILQVVLGTLRVELEDVRGRGRHKRVVLARSLAAHLARALTTHSYPEIAMALGRTNHSTVVTACQRIERQMQDELRVPVLLDDREVSLGELWALLKQRVLDAPEAPRTKARFPARTGRA